MIKCFVIIVFFLFFVPFSMADNKKPQNEAMPVYKIRGVPVVKGHPLYESYKETLSRFPDLEACKKEGFEPERKHITAHGRIFQTDKEFNVCFFWFFSSFENQKDSIIKYLDKNFIKYGLLNIGNRRTKSRYDNRGTIISASWSSDIYPPVYGANFWGYFTYWLFSPGVSLTIRVDKEGRISRVKIGYSVK